jgi:hypothetical protein
MVRYLPEFGFQPLVITGPGEPRGRWTPRDETLADDVPDATDVVRLSGPEPHQEGSGERLQRWLRIRSPWSSWWIEGVVAAGLRAASDTDLIYAWMQPYETAAAAARLSAQLQKPWVADLGDPWAFDEMIAYPSRIHRRLELRKMHALLGTAAAIVMSTDEAARRLVELFPDLRDRLVLSIPNGFDSGDFDRSLPPRDDDAFRIVHTGYLHTNLGQQYLRFKLARRILGGGDPAVDVLTRSHVYLLQAIDGLIRRRPELRGRIELHLAGVASDADHQAAAGYESVRMHGYVSHERAVELMMTADLLFLPMHDLPAGRRATIVPGKTYEYLASRTPILAAVPSGDARDLLKRAGNTMICSPRAVDCMRDAISAAFDARHAGSAAPTPDEQLLRLYEYRHLASRLAGLFDQVLGRP